MMQEQYVSLSFIKNLIGLPEYDARTYLSFSFIYNIDRIKEQPNRLIALCVVIAGINNVYSMRKYIYNNFEYESYICFSWKYEL